MLLRTLIPAQYLRLFDSYRTIENIFLELNFNLEINLNRGPKSVTTLKLMNQ